MRLARKSLAFVLTAFMVFTMLPQMALAASGTITEDGTYYLSDYGNDSAITINGGLTITLVGDSAITYTNVRIDCGAGVNLALDNVNIDNSATEDSCALAFPYDGSNNTLTLAGMNTLKSGRYQPGVFLPNPTQLTIQGSGSLTATGGLNGAGIGDYGFFGGGIVTINSGTVTAYGGSGGAGIGGSKTTGGGTVNISGGTVTATSYNGAGIGGGAAGTGGTVNISGGTVTATGENNGAGIGGGVSGTGGTVVISGGTVTATANTGADIGGGRDSSDHGTLKNMDGTDVYLTPIRLLGSDTVNTAVSSLTTDLTYTYGLNDVFSDSLGKLYFYLPLGTQTTQVVTPAKTFSGCAVTENSPTVFDFMVSASISPATGTFDKTYPADVTTAITWNGAGSVTDVKLSGTTIGEDSYEVEENTLAIKKDYLAGLGLVDGTSVELVISFDKGESATLTVTAATAPEITTTTLPGVRWVLSTAKPLRLRAAHPSPGA